MSSLAFSCSCYCCPARPSAAKHHPALCAHLARLSSLVTSILFPGLPTACLPFPLHNAGPLASLNKPFMPSSSQNSSQLRAPMHSSRPLPISLRSGHLESYDCRQGSLSWARHILYGGGLLSHTLIRLLGWKVSLSSDHLNPKSSK